MADETFTKSDFDKAVKDAVDAAIEKEQAKNQGLLDDLKKAQRELRAAKDIKPEDLASAEDRADKAEAKAKELESAVKSLTGERDKALKSLETEKGFTQKLLIQDGLKSAFIKNGVNDETFIDALTAKFSSSASVTIDGDVRKAMIGDKSLDDAVKEFAASDAGKKFVSAPVNSGGGAGGGTQKSEAKTMSREIYDALPQMEKAALGPQFAKGELKLTDA